MKQVNEGTSHRHLARLSLFDMNKYCQKKNVIHKASVSSIVSEYHELNESSNKSRKLSAVAQWHSKRRRTIIQKHPEILSLESSRSVKITLPLLMLSNLSLAFLSIISGRFSIFQLFLLAFGIGSVFSLWQLQILHEVLHGSMLGSGTKLHRYFHKPLLFLGSFPSAFGYWLYMQYGHLSHHRSVGLHSLNDAFESDKMDLADGDVLFVNHRMNMKGKSGPKINGMTLSIGRFFYQFWKPGKAFRNAALFSISFMLERMLLMMNDIVVALTGRNYFFPNKPEKFHRHVALYTRVGLLVRTTLCILAGKWSQHAITVLSTNRMLPWSWKPILFLMLSETLWSIPPHPACAMFITNHGSKHDANDTDGTSCKPSGSTYAGKWYSIFTLGTNFHVEHHDFPTMPLNQLGKLRRIAGSEFYGNHDNVGSNSNTNESRDNLLQIMKKSFAYPDFYACTNAADLSSIHEGNNEIIN